MCPLKPPSRQRPWLPKPTEKKPQEGRKERTSLYDSPTWRALRKIILQEQPLCVYCEQEGRIKAATIVDHIKPFRSGDHDFFDRSNLQGLCHSHHNKKSAKETHVARVGEFKGQLIIAYGPPGSGKTTWANTQGCRLVIDMDVIWQEVTGLGWYERTEKHLASVYKRRDHLIDKIGQLGKGQQAILISTNLQPRKIQEAINLYSPTIKEFRVDKQTCIDRVNNDTRRADKQAHIDLINLWFASNPGW